jgi:pyruvate carboxylase
VLREKIPNILFQMLLRGANAVGYTSYPDNVVRFFVKQAADAGMDLFRVFDSLNWVENMRVAMDAVLENGKLCEATLCYTGNMLAPAPNKYDLKYYVTMAKELERAGAHTLAIKDMAGVARPAAVRKLVTTLREETALPVHFHTHDTSGIAAASVLAAVDAGCDAVDGAMDAMSGLTSQPNLGSILAATADTERDPGIDNAAMRTISHYWEGVRRFYSGFESDIRAGTSDVYRHAMPGGQYTNLREQARSLGIDHRWPEVAEAYAQVNELFGDIVKVTPTSKVVGDMALMMVTQGLTPKQVLDPEREIAFPESVVQLFHGDLGRPPGGFPPALSRKVLQGAEPLKNRPGADLPPADLEATRAEAKSKTGREITDCDLASYLMYPKVLTDQAKMRSRYGRLSELPTPVFFYGMERGEEIAVDIDQGKTLVIRYLAASDPDDQGTCRVFFELNGQQRMVKVVKKGMESKVKARPKAEDGNPHHVAAPMPGMVISVAVRPGLKVERGDALVSIEAMKMESVIRAERAGSVEAVHVEVGGQVDAKDLMVVLS